jgi:hypothetical protein
VARVLEVVGGRAGGHHHHVGRVGHPAVGLGTLCFLLFLSLLLNHFLFFLVVVVKRRDPVEVFIFDRSYQSFILFSVYFVSFPGFHSAHRQWVLPYQFFKFNLLLSPVYRRWDMGSTSYSFSLETVHAALSL